MPGPRDPTLPMGLRYKQDPNGKTSIYALFCLPDGRKLERSLNSQHVGAAHRQYWRWHRLIYSAWYSGQIDLVLKLKPRKKRANVAQADKTPSNK